VIRGAEVRPADRLYNNIRQCSHQQYGACCWLQNGVIYFTSNPGTGTFTLNPTTLSGGDFDTLKNYNLTLKGGWNGDSLSPSFSGQTDFSNHPITIGTSLSPWVGSITLSDFTFTGASQTSLTVYTTTGNITLNNVDVSNQANGNNTALLNTPGILSLRH
jgi:hypothetical protein